MTAPPTDDEREALRDLVFAIRSNHRQVMTDPEWMVWSCICGDWHGEPFDVHCLRIELHRAGFRRQGPITDADLRNAGNAVGEIVPLDVRVRYELDPVVIARAALEAVGYVRSRS